MRHTWDVLGQAGRFVRHGLTGEVRLLSDGTHSFVPPDSTDLQAELSQPSLVRTGDPARGGAASEIGEGTVLRSESRLLVAEIMTKGQVKVTYRGRDGNALLNINATGPFESLEGNTLLLGGTSRVVRGFRPGRIYEVYVEESDGVRHEISLRYPGKVIEDQHLPEIEVTKDSKPIQLFSEAGRGLRLNREDERYVYIIWEGDGRRLIYIAPFFPGSLRIFSKIT